MPGRCPFLSYDISISMWVVLLYRSHIFDWLLSLFKNLDRHVQNEASLKVRFLIYERAVKDCVCWLDRFFFLGGGIGRFYCMITCDGMTLPSSQKGVFASLPSEVFWALRSSAAWFLQTLACLSPAPWRIVSWNMESRERAENMRPASGGSTWFICQAKQVLRLRMQSV